jgi:peptide/nickel transport system permease protein
VVQLIITLLLFQAATFFLIDSQPGDVSDLLTGNPQIPPSERQRLKEQLGLDRPVHERFVTYILNFYQGDWGVSFTQYPRPVTDIIAERLPRTLVLFLSASIVSFYVGFISGKYLAWRRGGFVEYASTIGGVALYTVFTPWFALMMIWFFAVTLGWFPAGKFLSPIKWIGAPVDANTVFIRMIWTTILASLVALAGYWFSNRVAQRYRTLIRVLTLLLAVAGLIAYWYFSGLGEFAWDIASHMVLPILTVTLIAFGGTMLLTRTSMLETLREDYILTARAKGLSQKRIRDKHAARNALLPVWTSLVFAIGFAVSGGIVTESIFSWPGIGLTLLNASLAEDIPLAMGTLTIIGVMVLVSHLVADIGYAFLDPRIRVH